MIRANFYKGMNLQHKILIPVLLVFIVSTLFISVFAYFSQKSIISDLMRYTVVEGISQLKRAATEAETAITALKDALNKNYIMQARAFRKLTQLAPQLLNLDRMTELAREIGWNEIHVVDANGILRWGNVPGFIGYDFSSADQTRPFLPGLTNREFEISQEAQPRGADRVLFKYTTIARRDPPGLIQVGVEPRELQDLIAKTDLASKVRATTFGHGGTAMLIDRDNRIIAHRDKKMEGKLLIDYDWGRTICELKTGAIEFNLDGEDYYCHFASWGNGQILVASLPEALYMGPLERFSIYLALAIIISIGLSFLVILRVSRASLGRPIGRISTAVRTITEGDLTCRIGVASDDELGDLANHLDTFIILLQEQVQSIRKQSFRINTSIQDLNVTNKEIASTSNQQAAAVKEVVTTMEDSDQLSRGISIKINEVARIADTTRESVVQGSSLIRENLAMMGEIKQKNADMLSGIRALNEKINSIWEVVNIINGIADQTKIIAFNAELEAAAAGEAGHNFEIVANEIRRLADGTVTSTAEIKKTIEVIQQSSDRLIVSSEQETEKIQQGWEISTRTGSLFGEIQQSSEASARSAAEIARSIEQQSSAFNQIVITMKQISEGIDNFVATTRSTSHSSGELQEISGKLNELIDRYHVEASPAAPEGSAHARNQQ